MAAPPTAPPCGSHIRFKFQSREYEGVASPPDSLRMKITKRDGASTEMQMMFKTNEISEWSEVLPPPAQDGGTAASDAPCQRCHDLEGQVEALRLKLENAEHRLAAVPAVTACGRCSSTDTLLHAAEEQRTALQAALREVETRQRAADERHPKELQALQASMEKSLADAAQRAKDAEKKMQEAVASLDAAKQLHRAAEAQQKTFSAEASLVEDVEADPKKEFYDAVIHLNDLRAIYATGKGWRVTRRAGSTYQIQDKISAPIVAVYGAFNAGKSLLLRNVSGASDRDFPSSSKIHTKGLSFRKLDVIGQTVLFLDTAGTNSPADPTESFRKITHDELLAFVTAKEFSADLIDFVRAHAEAGDMLSLSEAELEKRAFETNMTWQDRDMYTRLRQLTQCVQRNSALNEKKAEEELTKDIAFQIADAWIVVVGYVSWADQILLTNMARALAEQSRKSPTDPIPELYVVHNLRDARTVDDVTRQRKLVHGMYRSLQCKQLLRDDGSNKDDAQFLEGDLFADHVSSVGGSSTGRVTTGASRKCFVRHFFIGNHDDPSSGVAGMNERVFKRIRDLTLNLVSRRIVVSSAICDVVKDVQRRYFDFVEESEASAPVIQFDKAASAFIAVDAPALDNIEVRKRDLGCFIASRSDVLPVNVTGTADSFIVAFEIPGSSLNSFRAMDLEWDDDAADMVRISFNCSVDNIPGDYPLAGATVVQEAARMFHRGAMQRPLAYDGAINGLYGVDKTEQPQMKMQDGVLYFVFKKLVWTSGTTVHVDPSMLK